VLTNKLAAKLEALTPDIRWSEVTLLLVGDAQMTNANREYFGRDSATDVISFRYNPVPGETGVSGDLMVNVECAVRTGPQYDGADAELALYIAHGFNHLSGADDDTPAHRAVMRRTEMSWLKNLKHEIQNLILEQQ